MASVEPGDHWAWCYLDSTTLPPAGGATVRAADD
jgi:hypothetical protein